MAFEDISEATIAVLVDAFYARVRAHAQLGPIFAAALGPDGWPHHLRTLEAFWSSVMLTSGRYKGNPVMVHQALPDLPPALFAEWLRLFEATAADLFTPDAAARLVAKARNIARSLQLALAARLPLV